MSLGKKKLLIFIISYKASFRVKEVFDKIPFKKLKNFQINVLISDDCSMDDTIDYAKTIKKKDKRVFLNENKINLGYGAHIKKCLNFALKKKYNYAVMIHGDGQFNPRYIPDLLLKLEDNKVSAATGSRILSGINTVRTGGMPLYKMAGNILLTKLFNFLLNKKFTDAHTGLWAYNLNFLKNRKFNLLTNSFNFDQEFRFKNVLNNNLIKEIPIQTKYGDERSQLHIKYAIKFFLNCILFFFVKKKLIKLKKF
tara:strand:+ start:1235 stop:1993 length:759 start_codon:yes stop_codon:yes gene_type:complete